MLSTVNSSKRNRYYVIFFFPKSNLPNLLSIYSLADNRYQRQFSLFIFSLSIKTAANTICAIESFSCHLSLATVSLSNSSYLLSSIQLSVLVPYQLSTQKLYITPKKGISKLDVPLLGNAVPLRRQVTSGHCSTRLLPKI